MFFALQTNQMKPEPTFTHSQLSAKGRLPPKVAATIPPIPVGTYCSFHQERESISSPLESGLDLWFFDFNKMWHYDTDPVPGPSLKQVLAWDYDAVKKPKLATCRELIMRTKANWPTVPAQPPTECGSMSDIKQDYTNYPVNPQNHEK